MPTLLLLLLALPASALAVQPIQVERAPGAAPANTAAEQLTCVMQAAAFTGEMQKVCLTAAQRAASAANAERVAADRRLRAARDAQPACEGMACGARR